MIIPNIQRVLIKPISVNEIKSSGIVLSGQMKAGENLLYGEIIHAGTTRFEKGQKVFYSEYSSAAIMDYEALISGTKNLSELQKEGMVIVAEDDIMASYDPTEIPETSN